MAITAGDYLLWKLLKQRGCLPESPRVVEIGEANWYGDVPLESLRDDYGVVPTSQNLFELARKFYAAVLGYRGIVAIDPSGQAGALPYDLNRKVSDALPQFEVLINTGTIEHIFDQRQVWQTCHEITAPGGIMVHIAPMAGWFNHGFYTVQPTLLSDLAAANGYTLEAIVFSQDFQPHETTMEELTRGSDPYAGNAMLHWAWRKGRRNTIFQIPQQGYYAGTLSEEDARNWSKR
jgi:hypothetical protein